MINIATVIVCICKMVKHDVNTRRNSVSVRSGP